MPSHLLIVLVINRPTSGSGKPPVVPSTPPPKVFYNYAEPSLFWAQTQDADPACHFEKVSSDIA
jgi:hypothetical protein